MKCINVQQGSIEWHELRAKRFTASEAPAMMGDSKYQTRDALLHMKTTGEVPAVSKAQQDIFNRGHKTEEMARPLVEEMLGQELYPATGIKDFYRLPLLASFDGITADDSIIFEHKLWSEGLAQQVRNNELEPHYYWQLEQQLLISGAEKAIFVCSDGTHEKFAYLEYTPVGSRASQLLRGWEQFAADLTNYTAPDVKKEAKAAPVRELPAISYQMNGLALTSNLSVYRAAADKLLEKARQPLETDQDFADREALCKVFKKAEEKLKTLQEVVLGEVADIQQFTVDLKDMSEEFRQARLAGEKAVKTEKENRKAAIIADGRVALAKHCESCSQQLHGMTFPQIEGDFAGAAKGKRTLGGIQSAVNDELAAAKIRANEMLATGQANLKTYSATVADNSKHLFPDLPSHLFTAPDHFQMLVNQRISDYKAQEAARLEQERERIHAEEQRKAEAAARKLQAEKQTAEDNLAPLDYQEPYELTCSREFASKDAPAPLPEATVTIPKSEYETLKRAALKLECLEAAGVDNWTGYPLAMEALESEDAA